MKSKPIAIDLFCGLGGWTEGLQAAGYMVIGFDIERHQYGDKKYPAELVLQDILTLHGSQFKDAALIVASPPCQKYSYMAMPWTRAKDLIRHYEASEEARQDLNALFDACFRIQREASEAAGHHIPMVVENVKGAQRWVGRAKWHYGSFYLWGDIPALMPRTPTKRMKYQASAAPRMWKGREVPRLNDRAYKSEGLNWSDRSKRGQDFTRVAGQQCGTKQAGLSNEAWFDHGAAAFSSRSTARKQASAEIAKIPFPLAKWIGEVYYPHENPSNAKGNPMPRVQDAREAVEPTNPPVRCVPGVDRGRTGSESPRTVAEEIALCERYQADCERHMAAGYQPVGALIGWLDLEIEKRLIEERAR